MNGYNDPPYYISAYGLAKKRGFAGSLEDWLNSLVGPEGPQGKTAYQYAVDGGFVGTEEEFAAKMAKEAAMIANAENMNRHMLNISNPHGVTAEQVGALPMGGGAMQGPIVMGGNRVTGLGNPVEDGDAVPLGYAGQHFAPHKLVSNTYNIASEAELDNALSAEFATMAENAVRFIVISPTSSNLLGGISMLCELYKRSDSGYGTAKFTGYGIKSPAILYKTLWNGVWQPLEWGNPPMDMGVEYRTTERWDGNAVYTKAFLYGAMPNNAIVGVAHGAAATRMLRASGTFSASQVTLPYNSYDETVDIFANITNVYIQTNCDMSNQSAYVQIWYTKD